MPKTSSIFVAVLLTLAGMTGTANATLVISKKPTSNMSCAAGVCSATGADAVLNVNDLKALLNAADLRIESGSAAMDIVVVTKFKWTKPTRLTFDAWRSIAFQAAVTAEGTGAVSVMTNDGGTGGDYIFTSKGKLAFWDNASSLSINGSSFTLVSDIATLAADIAANPSGAYALAKGYDASVDGVYSTSPITTIFTGTFEGLGHAIANLKIIDTVQGRPDGLFMQIGPGTIRDIGVINVSMSTKAYGAGALLGFNNGGLVQNASSSGTLDHGGGLVGINEYNGTILNSQSSATIPGGGGGLVSVNSGALSYSSASGNVGGGGGLVDQNNGGSISYCHASGAVTSTTYGGGGLVGTLSYGSIDHSYATGAVNAVNSAGGLVGFAITDLDILDSYATGAVSAVPYGSSNIIAAGGLVGFYRSDLDNGKIVRSFATGAVNVSGGDGGGLVGDNEGRIEQSYATGAVSGGGGKSDGGGLVGRNLGTVYQSYAVGSIQTASNVGGLIGEDKAEQGDIYGSYWDFDTSNVVDPARGAGKPLNDYGITGLTTKQMTSRMPKGFDKAVWAQGSSVNGGFPYLVSNPPPSGKGAHP